MRAVVKLAANGGSQWVPTSYYQNPFGVSLAATPDGTANLTYKVQHTFNNPQNARNPVSITRSTTVATVTDTDHGLVTGDCVMVMGSGDANFETVVGVGADVTVVDANTYTYVVANTGAAKALPTVQVVTLKVFDHPLMTGLTGRQDGNYAFPVMATRLRVSSYVAGSVRLEVTQSTGR